MENQKETGLVLIQTDGFWNKKSKQTQWDVIKLQFETDNKFEDVEKWQIDIQLSYETYVNFYSLLSKNKWEYD